MTCHTYFTSHYGEAASFQSALKAKMTSYPMQIERTFDAFCNLSIFWVGHGRDARLLGRAPVGREGLNTHTHTLRYSSYLFVFLYVYTTCVFLFLSEDALNNLLKSSWFYCLTVVYFDQRSGALQSKSWSKYVFYVFCMKNLIKEQKEEIQRLVSKTNSVTSNNTYLNDGGMKCLQICLIDSVSCLQKVRILHLVTI